ncbi:MAG: chromate transporter [Rhodospirillales bacterium 69-11]|nr:chromate transporter [Rhodospirillales bacterium]MBN8928780.1 chromate transporter [Rhodospirillales bacterium]OJW21405.1 MAG: chromate transporter [Rhodospirillales bacterium 69-11]
MSGTLPALAAIFAQLSLLAFGGGNTILPEMQRQVTQVHPWMTPQEFAALYALAQAAPGPNMLVSTLIGWRVAGFGGALVATGALTGPSSVLTFFSAHLWHKFRDRPWRRTIQAGLMPVTAGLVMAGAVVLARSTSVDWRAAALTLVATLLFLSERLHPMLVLALAAVAGALGLVG